MLLCRIFLFFFLLVYQSSYIFCQSYFANGTTVKQGEYCYELTQATNWNNGSVWYADKLNLDKNFDLEFELNFGDKNIGADGIVFVLQTNGTNALGLPGGGLGFEGFYPSLGIEFDDWNNTDQGDIAADHIAILKNGSVDHNGPNSLVSPVSALPNDGNIEDGQNHLVRITWDPSKLLLVVYFDCEERVNLTLDIKEAIFAGENTVFWGFTSSTGGENNKQTVCLSDEIIKTDTIEICEGESVILRSRRSQSDSYLWYPNIQLDNNLIQNPVATPDESTTYTVEYFDRCGTVNRDSTYIAVIKKPDLSNFNDTTLCKGETWVIDLINPYGEIYWNDNLADEYVLSEYDGNLEIKSVNDCGSDSIEIAINTIDCTCDMWFPNVFTPNNDGINDLFGPINPCIRSKKYSLEIFNRWGERVFETNDISQMWDGRISNTNAVESVYFWISEWISSEMDGKNQNNTENGIVELIR